MLPFSYVMVDEACGEQFLVENFEASMSPSNFDFYLGDHDSHLRFCLF